MPIARSLMARNTDRPSKFPLTLSANGLYLQGADGAPFLIVADGVWNSEVQARTFADIDTILNNRAAAGYNGLIMEAIERGYSGQTPIWKQALNASIPFSTTANDSTMTWTVRNESYWTTLDYIVNKAKALGMVLFINFLYWGFGNGSDGWAAGAAAASDADLQAYGSAMATRYRSYGNVYPCVGGDDAADGGINDIPANTPNRTKQWQFIVGWRSVDPSVLVTGHTARSGTGGAVDGDAWLAWQNFAGFNLPSIYAKSDASDTFALGLTARARGRAFIAIEGPYESAGGSDLLRKYAWHARLSGACGIIGGEDPRWGLGAPGTTGSVGIAGVISSHLATTGDAEMKILGDASRQYDWWTGVSFTDTTIVTSTLSSGANQVCPMRGTYNGGTKNWVKVYVPSAQTVTLAMTAFSQASVRIRLLNVQTGAYTLVGSFANTGTQGVVCSGEAVIVAD